jgi:hypothetical protein
VPLGLAPPARTLGHPLRKRSVVPGRDHARRRSSAHSPPAPSTARIGDSQRSVPWTKALTTS